MFRSDSWLHLATAALCYYTNTWVNCFYNSLKYFYQKYVIADTFEPGPNKLVWIPGWWFYMLVRYRSRATPWRAMTFYCILFLFPFYLETWMYKTVTECSPVRLDRGQCVEIIFLEHWNTLVVHICLWRQKQQLRVESLWKEEHGNYGFSPVSLFILEYWSGTRLDDKSD